ncbi:MAG TPA: hypothetical protein VFE52_04715 [Devosia sp.]|nr:hypothetical protein [Devosia sp.]
MKTVRLLPVVIFAAAALLLFKGIGLVTTGGYVLTGPTPVQAAGSPAPAEAPAGDLGVPAEVTLTDTNPVLDDTSPTLPTRGDDAGAHGAEAEHGLETEHAPAEAHAEADAQHGAVETAEAPVAATLPTNEHGDALPLIKDGMGNIVPLEADAGEDNEAALLQRLGERRAALDAREEDLLMRTTLLEAAEKRLAERTQELAALEARVAELVDQKEAAEQEGFKAVVSMYETMKAKDAAKIFDTLSMPVLLKVARAMSPRKMSPILAAMSPEPAQKLTTALTASEGTEVVAQAGENLAELPRIIGQ